MQELGATRVFSSPLGEISIAASAGRIVKVEFVEDGKNQSHTNHPSDGTLADRAATQLMEYFCGSRETFDLPLGYLGTKFQMSVWAEIAAVGFGETATYKDLAKRIGNPKASRAVGGAVGANPIGIIIGCHRILGSTGKLTGYSGGHGIPTKVKLLELEGIEYK